MKTLKNEGKSRKNHKPRGGLRYDLSCTFRALKVIPNCLVGPSECETKFSSKEIWYVLWENAWFPWQPLM